MKLDSVAVLGGGPGGLYAARLFKLAHPHADVVVYEQSLPETTFGFGVALASRTQRNLEAADPETLADILAAGLPHDMSMVVGQDSARVRNGAVMGIARPGLLAILRHHAEAAGVTLHYGVRVAVDEVTADLVVAADGVNSQTRSSLAEQIGASVDVAGCLYLWAGADFALDTAIFAPVTTTHGTFVTHAYPYRADRSTILIETDQRTWRAAGFDATTESTPPDQSDEVSLRYLQEAFADHLDGHQLIGNRTRWMRFRTVHCRRWSHGNVVLIGDAAHTAHYSVGSGTKLAMEDAIALRDALAEATSVPKALAQYERVRRPQVERLQDLARRSQLWWDSFPHRTHLPVHQLMLAYMTRTGNVALQRFAGTNPDTTRRGLAEFAEVDPADVPLEDVTGWALDQPLRHGERRFASRRLEATERAALTAPTGPGTAEQPGPPPFDQALALIATSIGDPWGHDADVLVKHVNELVRSGWAGCWLAGPGEAVDDRGTVLTRLDLGERLRAETGGLTVVDGPATVLDDLAAGVVAGRADLVCPLSETTRPSIS
jgi:anthraniloyl-CoA monooxygenase